MKLAYKLTLAFIAGTCLILSVNAVRRVQREIALFERYVSREHRVIGRTVGAAAVAVWRTEGRERAMQVIRDADQQHEIQIRWLDGSDADATVALSSGQSSSTLLTGPHGERFRKTVVPVRVDAGHAGAIELSESLDEEGRYIEKTILDTFATTVTLVAVCGILAMALGVWLVGRPMRRLVEKARRVGEGDFNTPLELRQHDELGVLATEMNAMCERLVVATDRADAEAEARIATLEQLRHADRLTTVGKLASGIAHELGTPLNVVSGRARMIITGEAEGQEVVESAEVIVSASRRMTTIIRQLLDFARRRGPQKAEEDVHDVVRRALSLVGHLMEKRGVSLELVGGTALAEIDTTQIEQVVTNLVVNGAQAMVSGGLLTVVVRQVSAIAPLDLDRVGTRRQWVAIAVVDQGRGIPAEDLPHIFEPFYTTKGVGEGTGLGLSVAYGIVQEHGGFITVESQPRGTTFTVHLPTGGQS